MEGILVVILLVFLLFVILLSTFQLVCLWIVYKKAGKGGWETLIPIYNNYVLVEISGLHWIWFLIPLLSGFVLAFFSDDSLFSSIMYLLIYLFAIFASFNIYYNLSKKFGKNVGFAFGLFFLPLIFLPILAFSKNCLYRNDIPVSEHGVFGTPNNKVNNMNTYNNVISTDSVDTDSQSEKSSFCGNCGFKLDNDSKFCPNCGKEIN